MIFVKKNKAQNSRKAILQAINNNFEFLFYNVENLT